MLWYFGKREGSIGDVWSYKTEVRAENTFSWASRTKMVHSGTAESSGYDNAKLA